MSNPSDVEFLKEQFREAFFHYIFSEGCGCCESEPVHGLMREKLAELVQFPKTADGTIDYAALEAQYGRELRA